jgi:hypothetical protein
VDTLTTIMLAFIASVGLGQSVYSLPNTKTTVRQLGIPAPYWQIPIVPDIPQEGKVWGIMDLDLGTAVEQYPTKQWSLMEEAWYGIHSCQAYRFEKQLSLNGPKDTTVDIVARFVNNQLVSCELVFPISEAVEDGGFAMSLDVIYWLSNTQSYSSFEFLSEYDWNREAGYGRLAFEDADGNQLGLDWNKAARSLVLVVRAGWIDEESTPSLQASMS